LTVAVGKKVPAFSLPRSDGSVWKSADAKDSKLVLYFYPKDMTPGCTLEGQDFRDLHAAFKRAQTTVLGVSKDSGERHAKFRAKEKFQFELLSDEDEGSSWESNAVLSSSMPAANSRASGARCGSRATPPKY
jgi:peroxiredoxin Q/BCP